MAKDQSAKRIHLRLVSYGNGRLTFCGKKWKHGGPFNNPDATLCERCVNLGEAVHGMDSVELIPVVNSDGNLYRWRVKATPPRLELVPWGGTSAIIDRNDPDAEKLVLNHEQIEAMLPVRSLRMLWADREAERAEMIQAPSPTAIESTPSV